jgi:protein SCO1/2
MTLIRRYGLFIAAAVVLVAGLVWLSAQPPRGGGGAGFDVSFELGGAFALTGPDGATVTQDHWPGKLLLIVFGYRFCPDVCPTLLQTVAGAMDALGPEGERVQPLFISVDPARDSPSALGAYVAQFHPRLVGLTGTPEQVAAAARAFRVFYRKASGGTPDGYSIDHSAYVYLARDTGKVFKVFGPETTAAAMAAAIRGLMRPAAS